MMMLRFGRHVLGSGVAVVLLAGCGASQGQRNGAMPMNASHQLKRNASGCIAIQDSTGAKYTAAQIGGGNYSDVEFSSTPCTIGIYINGKNGPKALSYAAVNGPFNIGIYFDNAGNRASLSYASICPHGSSMNYDGCLTGTSRSSGTGLYIRNTPKISVSFTEVDSYTAGFVANPCPDNANEMSVDYTTITNAVYSWSYSGGENSFLFDSPTPKSSCNGSSVGGGFFHP